jgi:hypothetical protein
MTETDLADAGCAPIELFMQEQRRGRHSDPALMNLRRDQSEKVLNSLMFVQVLYPGHGVMTLSSSPTPAF